MTKPYLLSLHYRWKTKTWKIKKLPQGHITKAWQGQAVWRQGSYSYEDAASIYIILINNVTYLTINLGTEVIN